MSEQTSQPSSPITVDRFRPRAMVRLKESEVLRARYPAIDAHNHFSEQMDVEQVIANMDACNIQTYIDLSGWNGDRLKRRLDLLKGRYPDRFAVFYVPDFARVNEPGFGERVARELEDAVRAGAQGLKIYKVLGLSVRDADGTLLHVDDQRLYPLWQAAGELGVPVMIHVGDPHAFFQPLDENNERYAQLIRHPDWHFYGPGYPSIERLLEERDHIVAENPQTRFIGAHIGSDAENLDRASDALDRYPNYIVDFSARVAELGRQPRRARAFFEKYQDRILFGTDGHDYPQMYRSYFRFLETDDECFEYYMYPQHGFWQISALNLPETILWKIYAANPTRVIPGVDVPDRQ